MKHCAQDAQKRSPAMKITVLGIDLAKNVFHLHGVDDQGTVRVRLLD
jgi:hypothetical protein